MMLFLSHSSRDKPIVRTLSQHLEEAGFPTWLDEWNIRVGECIPTGIQDGLANCRFVIVALSPHAVSSGWVDREWKAMYWIEVEKGRIRVLPVLIEACEVPLLLRTKRYANLSENDNDGLHDLIDSLNAYIAEDATSDFYAFAPVVAKQLVLDPPASARNEHWDNFNSYIGFLTGTDRFKVQKLNSLYYLGKWGLSVVPLRQELGMLGFPTAEKKSEFTPDLVEALEIFRKHTASATSMGYLGN